MIKTRIEPVGSTAETLRENKALIRELERQMESGRQPQTAYAPPLGTRHIGSRLEDGYYRHYYYHAARGDYLMIPQTEKRR